MKKKKNNGTLIKQGEIKIVCSTSHNFKFSIIKFSCFSFIKNFFFFGTTFKYCDEHTKIMLKILQDDFSTFLYMKIYSAIIRSITLYVY